jgi:S-adenosylmethionine-diacylgycerolhomoserine-N-methlytransferase
MTEDAGHRMDRMYRFQRHIYDVTRRYYLVGRTTLINGLVPPDNGTVLEVGCGTGWNLIEAARKYPGIRFQGFDVSRVMLDTAQRNVARAGLSDRVSLSLADAATFAHPQQFDRVFASYVLSMVPNWTTAMERAVMHLAPGGSFHIVDFGAANDLPTPLRVGLHAWLDGFDVTPRVSLKTEADRLARKHDLTSFFTELRRGYAQYVVLSRR